MHEARSLSFGVTTTFLTVTYELRRPNVDLANAFDIITRMLKRFRSFSRNLRGTQLDQQLLDALRRLYTSLTTKGPALSTGCGTSLIGDGGCRPIRLHSSRWCREDGVIVRMAARSCWRVLHGGEPSPEARSQYRTSSAPGPFDGVV